MNKAKGQGLVEFALILPLFIAIMAGLLDGTRLLFTYNELQEAARVGARWGAIEVDRDCWGTFAHLGNSTATTSFSVLSYTPSGCPTSVHTIAGEVASKLVGIDKGKVTLSIATDPTSLGTDDYTASDSAISKYVGDAVTVQVTYTFKPVLGFDHLGITLTGKATAYHA
jgi:Flp pilus assembly protein TadG